MANIQPLFSGSSGNAILVESDKCAILVDAGVSGKRILSALEKCSKTISSISAIIITHEHIDHVKSVGMLARKYNIPVFANALTWEAMLPLIGDVSPSLQRIIQPDEELSVGDIALAPFKISHDAACPVGYNFFIDNQKLTVATDIGRIDEKLFLKLTGSNKILLESNYDVVMLQKGPYPKHLKERIAGKYGHLSNKEAAMICARLACLGTKQIYLGHLSKENNTPQLALEIVSHYIENCGIKIGRDISLSVAPRSCV